MHSIAAKMEYAKNHSSCKSAICRNACMTQQMLQFFPFFYIVFIIHNESL
jgi:hypothetical protein